ncbi:MAG: bifunctional oligoribonuclease/PAP phosphatase NrnA [Actinomycetota bacterium]
MSDPLTHAAEVLAASGTIAIACHVNPDVDALGSMLGLSNHLRARGAETVCSFGNDPFELPRWAVELPGIEAIVEPRSFPKEPPVMVTCDTASMDRLGMLAPAASRAGDLIWIDHHMSNDGLGTISLVDPRASSTSELVYRLIRAMGGEVTQDVAICLYAGLVADTGRFQHEAVRPDTLRLGAELREVPFDHARLARVLYEDNGAAYLRLLGVVLQRVTLEPDADLVWTYLTRTDLAGAAVHISETDDMIDVVRTAREADVAAVVKEQRDGRLKVSMRSRGGHDLAKVAAAFGGGGHRLAAGYTSRHGLAATIERLKVALRGEPVEP